jgi:hypothetical protein
VHHKTVAQNWVQEGTEPLRSTQGGQSAYQGTSKTQNRIRFQKRRNFFECISHSDKTKRITATERSKNNCNSPQELLFSLAHVTDTMHLICVHCKACTQADSFKL